MTDIPLEKRLDELRTARLIAAATASITESQPQDHIFAVLFFIAIALSSRFSLIEGASSNG